MTYRCSAVKRARMENNVNLDDSRFDDCWIHVFHHFPVKNRIPLESVSQKWRNLMPYSDIHSFQLAELDCWSKSARMEAEYMIDGASETVRLVKGDQLCQILESVLNRIGPYVQELDFLVEQEPIFRLNKDLMDFVVEKAPNLVKLKLTRCLLALGCFPTLENLRKLEMLQLNLVTIIEDDLSSTAQDLDNVKRVIGSTIQNIPILKKLDLVLETTVTPPVRNPSLAILFLHGEKMNGEDVLDIIQYCPNLEVLVIDEDAPIFPCAELGKLHNLRDLSLATSNFSSQDLAAIGEGCPNMESLSLRFPYQINSWAQLWLLRNLQSLDLYPWDFGLPVTFPDSALASVASYGVLKALHLPHSTLTDEGLKHLAKDCPNLVSLNFHGVEGISDEGVKVILEKCKKFKELFLSNTSIGNPTLTAIGAMGCSLRTVDLEETRVTVDGIRSLLEERNKRLKNGEKLAKLIIHTTVECPFPMEIWRLSASVKGELHSEKENCINC